MRRPAGGLKTLAAAMAACVVAVLAPMNAEAAPGLATHIVFTRIWTPSVNVPATPGAPAIFVTQDRDFSVSAEFRDDSGAQRAAYLLPATAHLYVDGDPVEIASQTVAAGDTSVTFTGLRLPEQNHVRLRMTLTTTLGILIPVREGFSEYFDVQRTSVIAPFSSNPTGIGNGGGTNNPCEAVTFCADLILHTASGVTSDQIGSFGFCQATDSCLTGEYVQALVDLNPSVYTRNAPMKLVLKCPLAVCDALITDRHRNTSGGGHNGGNGGKGHLEGSHITLLYSLSATGALASAPLCTQSGRVQSGAEACHDVTQDFKDAVAWNFVLLAPGDIRGSVK